jgi:hypothetical protein
MNGGRKSGKTQRGVHGIKSSGISGQAFSHRENLW